MTFLINLLGAALPAHRRVIAAVATFSLAINLLLLTPSLYMMQTYDRVLSSRNEGTLWLLTLILAFLLVVEGALEWTRSQALSRLTMNIESDISSRLFDSGFVQNFSDRNVLGRALTDLTLVRQFASGKGLIALFDLPWLPVYLIACTMLNPWIGLFGLLSTVLLISLAWFHESATTNLFVQSNKLGMAANHWADASARHSEVVQAMGMLAALRTRWHRLQNNHLSILSQAQEKAAALGGLSRFIRSFLQSLVLGVGAYLVIADQMTAGGMIAASVLLSRALAPVDMAIGHWKLFVTARDAYQRLENLLAQTPATTQQRVKLPRPIGLVTVQQLVIHAPTQKEPILRGVNFEIKPGQVVAVVGPSGSGKSTLARALVGIWPPTSGAVRLDGAEVSSWQREDLGQYLGYLPQDVELLDGTVAENIARFGQIQSEQVVAAAKWAGVHELILSLPNGYETILGNGSIGAVRLSGGQRQRIALARALFGDPALVVLDEPNSNLDDLGDMALIKALSELRNRRRTVIVVTHRRNLLSFADVVLVLNQGRVQAMGPSSEILKPNTHSTALASKAGHSSLEGNRA